MAKETASSFEAEAITKLLLKAKSTDTELNFAFGLAAKPTDCGLILDRRKPGGVLKKMVKGMPGIKKACFGTLRLDGNRVMLQPNKPLKGIIRQLSRRFREEGMAKFKPVLVGDDGEEIDEDSLPDAELFDDSDSDRAGAPDADGSTANSQLGEGPDARVLQAQLVKLAQALKALGTAAPAGVGARISAAATQLSQGDLQAVQSAIAEIKTALTTAASATPKEPVGQGDGNQMGKLKQVLIALLARVKTLPEGQAQGDLLAEVKRIGALLQQAEAEPVQRALQGLARSVEAAAAQGQSSSDPQVVWREAKETVDGAISQLQAKLMGFKDPVLDRIAEYGLNGLTEGHQTALQKALFEFKDATGAEKAQAAKALAEQAQSYKSFVTSNRVMALCEKNPFGVAVPIRQELGAALDRIAQLAKSAT